MQRPRLKDNKGAHQFELYPLGQIPEETICEFGRNLACQHLIGTRDLTGDLWSDILADSIGGLHLDQPLGLADVIYKNMAWSAKTVKQASPHQQKAVRVISGRCSPDFSYGITDPHTDIQQTGAMVLSIYNERVNIAKEKYEPLREIVLMRNFDKFEFSVFERDIRRYATNEYRWEANKNGNLQGYEIATNKHRFTWQPHGSQFTILHSVPPSAIKFAVRKPPSLDVRKALEQAGFDESWITIL